MRVRTADFWDAGAKRAILLGARPDPRVTSPSPGSEWSQRYLDFLDSGEEARPGDVWILRQPPGQPNQRSWDESHPDWPIIGYAMTCPLASCEHGLHAWDHAHSCPAGKSEGGVVQPCEKGPDRGCWDWSGSAYDGTLTASPSLHCVAELGGCGWHGHLVNGEMVG